MSKPVTVNIPHQLGRVEARRRIEEGFGKLAGQLGSGLGAVDRSWNGDRLNFSLRTMGQSVTGAVEVTDREVMLEVLLPGFLAAIANKVKGKLQREGQVLLEDKRR